MKSTSKITAKNGSSLLKSLKGFVLSKPFVMFALLSCVMISSTFAASDSIEVLDSWSDKILDLLSSSWVKVLCLVALIIEAIGVVVSGQQGGGGQIIKRFAPWIIGTLILLCASGICSYFLADLEFDVSLLLPNSSAISSIA